MKIRDLLKPESIVIGGKVQNKDPRPDVITALLDAGADVTLKDQWDHTAADYARKNIKLKDTDVLNRLEATGK